ncbi:unnamed protein product [Periconia digitata]|uniref:Histone H4 n=1 Tax=Periconia digitata TaxID=1303443 RepID=A0A9W4UCT9_9PLEO|nr:unnamed protein product [Periconia digitata]
MAPPHTERPRQFAGTPRFSIPSNSATSSSRWQSSATMAGTPATSRQTHSGLGLGGKGKGLGQTLKRHSRLARRGGIKRLSADVYGDVRAVLKARLQRILGALIPLVEHSNRKTISVEDVIFTLNRLGNPIYGFQPSFDGRHRT